MTWGVKNWVGEREGEIPKTVETNNKINNVDPHCIMYLGNNTNY